MIFSVKKGARVASLLLAALLPFMFLCGCRSDADGMKDGFYSAEAAEYDAYGWKEYITLYVANGVIVTVDYDAKNPSGFIKSWDMAYMREMNAVDGTYPNKYTREYSEALINRQDPERVDAISGATHSHETFQRLVLAAMEQARRGDGNVAYVDMSEGVADEK